MEKMKQKVACPSCGSENVKSTVEQKAVTVPFAPKQSYDARIDHCGECGMSGDFFKANEGAVAHALNEARRLSAISMMNGLVEKNHLGMAYMERVLDLPARTMMRWKMGDCSAGALALLRIISTYPWTLDVADAQYEPRYAAKRLTQEGVKTMCRLAEENLIATNVELSSFDQNGIQGKFTLSSLKHFGYIAEENTQANSVPIQINRLIPA